MNEQVINDNCVIAAADIYTVEDIFQLLVKCGWAITEHEIYSNDRTYKVLSRQVTILDVYSQILPVGKKLSILLHDNYKNMPPFEIMQSIMALCMSYELKFFGNHTLETIRVIPDDNYTFHQLFQDIIKQANTKHTLTIDDAIETLEERGYREPDFVNMKDCNFPRHVYLNTEDVEDFTIYGFDTDEELIGYAESLIK